LTDAAILEDNPGFTLNSNRATRHVSCPRYIASATIALFFLSGHVGQADPVGDFFKKVGNSISKAFQPQPTPHQARKTTRPSRQSTSQRSTTTEAKPAPPEEAVKPAKQETLAPAALPALAAPPEKAKGDMPYGIPVPGQKGMVISPYSPEGSYVDVTGFSPGSAVKDPYTGKIFLVP